MKTDIVRQLRRFFCQFLYAVFAKITYAQFVQQKQIFHRIGFGYNHQLDGPVCHFG
jgi:hypothetical protein